MGRLIMVLALAAVMATMIMATAATALARVDQAVERALNQTQVAVKEVESPAPYQAVEQVQNANRVEDWSPTRTGGSITSVDALLLLRTVALLTAGGVLLYSAIWWQSQRR